MSLPDGWIRQYDSRYDRHFYVDTRSNPPRSTWVHPYEDEQVLAEQGAGEASSSASGLDAPPSYDVATRGRTPETRSKDKSGPSWRSDSLNPVPAGSSSQKEQKRGLFGRLKDKAIGTKEEREEQRRIRAEQAARAEERARQARLRQLAERETYMRAHGGYAPYHPSYGPRPAYAPAPAPASASGFGGDNTAAFLLGGLATGLLIGDILGGGLF